MGNGVEPPGKFSAGAGQHTAHGIQCAGAGVCHWRGHRPDGHQRQETAQVHRPGVCGVHSEYAAAAAAVLFVLRADP